MKELIVNDIVEQDGVTHGIVAWNDHVKRNLYTMYDKDHARKIITVLEQSPVSLYDFVRCCQYLVQVQYQPDLGGFSMKISDFKGDVDLALDEYRKLQGKGWRQEDTNKIMKICEEIRKKKDNCATMKHIPLPTRP
jgi:hypothetical protein